MTARDPSACELDAVIGRLTENEKDRLLAGRDDWREEDWQDHCGNIGCEHCEGAYIPDGRPLLLSDADKAIRARLGEQTDD